MSGLMLLDYPEELNLRGRIETLTVREIRRLWVLMLKLKIKQRLLAFDWPPRELTANEVYRLSHLRLAVMAVKNAPKPGVVLSSPWILERMVACQELLDDLDTMYKSHFASLSRDQEYSIMMSQRYLLSLMREEKLANEILSVGHIRSQQDALSVELSSSDPSKISRILGIVDMIRYVPIPDKVQTGELEGCSICYEKLEEGIPHGADVQVAREIRDNMINNFYTIRGTSARLTHHTAMLYCGHSFGSRCIWRHLKDNNTCPYCRQDFTMPLVKYEEYEAQSAAIPTRLEV